MPVALPALTRSVKLQRRAAKVGFDWPETGEILDKLKEEVTELEEEIPEGRRERMEEEFGDIMFVLANLARRLDIDPENALRGANSKFMRRFSHIERRLADAGATLDDASLGRWKRYGTRPKLWRNPADLTVQQGMNSCQLSALNGAHLSDSISRLPCPV